MSAQGLGIWEGVDAKDIAEALFKVSEGRVTRLATRDWKDESSIWERAAAILFPDEMHTSRDRFFLWTSWMQDRKNICVS